MVDRASAAAQPLAANSSVMTPPSCGTGAPREDPLLWDDLGSCQSMPALQGFSDPIASPFVGHRGDVQADEETVETG